MDVLERAMDGIERLVLRARGETESVHVIGSGYQPHTGERNHHGEVHVP